MEDPSVQVKPVAISQYPRHYKDGKWVMGYTLRDQRHRYIRWILKDFRGGETSGPIVAEEFYDYVKEPLERRNLIDDPAYSDEVAELKLLFEELVQSQGQTVEK